MDRVILIAAFIICAITIFIVVYMANATKQERHVNKVHFYVARDMDDTLWLYISKPYRKNDYFYPSSSEYIITSQNYFCKFGLDKNDYANLKWEDEPVEVFINMEDWVWLLKLKITLMI